MVGNKETWKPQRCFNYINCTGTNFIPNWTDIYCVPNSVKEIQNISLSVISIVGVVGVTINVLVLSVGCLKFASNLNFKMNPPQNCSLLVPCEGYIKLFSKIQCFTPVLAS